MQRLMQDTTIQIRRVWQGKKATETPQSLNTSAMESSLNKHLHNNRKDCWCWQVDMCLNHSWGTGLDLLELCEELKCSSVDGLKWRPCGWSSPLHLPVTWSSQSLLQPLDHQDTAHPLTTHTVLFTVTSTCREEEKEERRWRSVSRVSLHHHIQ